MKRNAFLLFYLFVSTSSAVVAQQNMAPLDIGAPAIYNLVVTPEERFIINTSLGEVFVADSLTGRWRNNHRADSVEASFTMTTGLALGAQGLTQTSWNLDDGKAWVSLPGTGIAYTDDRGLTWTHLPLPDTTYQDYTTLYFTGKGEGLIGSTENRIGYTTDNCQHWQLLPTPLDQRAYAKTNLNSEPSITNVAMLQHYFLVTQEDMVFYTRRDAIRWQHLPGYTNFHTDAQADVVYLVREDNRVVRTNSHLQVVYQYPTTFAAERWYCRNGNLYATDGQEITQYARDNTSRTVRMMSEVPAAPEYYLFLNGPRYFFFVREDTVFISPCCDTKVIPWEHPFKLPFHVKKPENLSYLGFTSPDELLYQPSPDSLYYYNMKTGALKITSEQAMFAEFSTNGITSITFHYDDEGCYDNLSKGKTYTLHGGRYVADKQSLTKCEHVRLNTGALEIDSAAVNALLRTILHPTDRLPTGADLPFTAKDFAQCKKDIQEYKRFSDPDKPGRGREPAFTFDKNNIDFDRLTALVDSIPTVDPHTLETAWWNHTFWFYEDSRKTIGITLRDSRNNTLEISQKYSGKNSLCLIWLIEIRGISLESMDHDINRFIQTYCPSLLPQPNDMHFMHALVKAMYK